MRATHVATGRRLRVPTVVAARVIGVLALVAVVLPGHALPVLAQSPGTAVETFPDLKSLVLTADELPPGYVVDAARTGSQARPDGSATYETVYVRNPSAAPAPLPSEIRLATGRTGSGVESARLLASTRDSLTATGWTTRPVPLLGDEALGVEARGAPAVTGGTVGYGFMFRFGRHLITSFVSGTDAETSFDAALGHAVRMSARLDSALAVQPVNDPGPAPARVTVASSAPDAAASTASADPTPGPGLAAARASVPPDPSPAAATAKGPATRPSVSTATVVADLELKNAPELSADLRVGGFSGLIALDQTGTSFMTLTDRGPNMEIQVGGQKQMAFPLPSYAPRLLRLQADNGSLRVIDTITMKLPDGYKDPITKSRDISGLPISESVGEGAYSSDGKQRYGFDPNGVDSESLALDPRDGSYWVGDEYGPSIVHLAADGTVKMRIVPRGLAIDAPGQNVRELLPDAFMRRKPNRGFEGIAIAPDGSRVFAILQSPLLNPDKKSGEASRTIRILALDTSNASDPKLAGVYLYQTQAYSEVGAAEQDNIVVGDMAAVSATKLLVGERDSQEGSTHNTVFLIDLARATDVSGRNDLGGKTLEQASESELQKAGIAYVAKSTVVDLAQLGFRPGKVEGLALVDPTTLAVVSDNDFGIKEIDAKGRIVRSGQAPRLVVIRVPSPLQ